ncbi:MAG: ABC transporter permease [Clostridiales Family XIII bacterium]|nr:ABC transporter permease [Clostridiales Family XIII bacterium]
MEGNAKKAETGGIRGILRVLSRIHHRIMGLYLFILFLILWQIAPSVGWTNPVLIPSFSTVLAEGAYIGLGNVLVHIAISMKRVFVGFIISTAVALPLGFILSGALPRIAEALNPLMHFLSQVPPFILYPVFLIIVGPGEFGIYAVILWSAFWPILFTTIDGMRGIDARLIQCARSMNAGNFAVFTKVVFPAIFPNLVLGIRSGLTMSFLMMVGAESLGAASGMGFMIRNAQQIGAVARIYLGALLVAIVGFLLNFAAVEVEKTLVTWKEIAQ